MSDINDLLFRIRQVEIDESHDFADLTDDALGALDELVTLCDRYREALRNIRDPTVIVPLGNLSQQQLERELDRAQEVALVALADTGKQQTADVPSGHGNTAD